MSYRDILGNNVKETLENINNYLGINIITLIIISLLIFVIVYFVFNEK